MKKKLFLVALAVAALICAFALTVGATSIPDWTEVCQVEGMEDKSVFGTDGTAGATSRVLMSDGVTYPAYYVCNNSSSLGLSFTSINKNTGKSYSAVDVIKIEIPNGVVKSPMSVFKTANGYTSLVSVTFPEGFTTMGSYTFMATTALPSALVEVNLPSTLTTFGINEFINCTSLESLIIPEGVTSIPKEFAYNCTALKKLVLPSTIKTIGEISFRNASLSEGLVIPEGCTTISNYAFKGTGVTSVYVPSTITSLGEAVFAECQSLTDVVCKSSVIGVQMFYDCDELVRVTLENTVEIKKQAFCNPNGGILKITELVLPEGLTTIGDYAFIRSQITELVLPSTLVSMGSSTFESSTGLKKVVVLGSAMGGSMFNKCSSLEELVLTDKFVTFSKDCIANVSQSRFLTYYTGTDYERIKTLCSSTTRFSQAKYYSYADYESGNYTSNKFMVIYDVNLCVAAFEGVHTNPGDDGDCTTAVLCSYCAEHVFREAKAHARGEKISYTSFTESGAYYVGCTNEGCTLGTTESVGALFTCLGYSLYEGDTCGIAIGFRINVSAVELYRAVSKNDFSYGLFVVSEKRLGDNYIFGEDNTVADGVVSVDTSRYAHSVFVLKIFGFNEENKNVKIALGAYTAEDDGTATTYTYMQASQPTQGEKYSFVSFGELANN